LPGPSGDSISQKEKSKILTSLLGGYRDSEPPAKRPTVACSVRDGLSSGNSQACR